MDFRAIDKKLNMPAEIGDALSDLLKCSECRRLPVERPITQCRHGHLICSQCRQLLDKLQKVRCPNSECSARVLRPVVRSLVAEKLLDLLRDVPCQSENEGYLQRFLRTRYRILERDNITTSAMRKKLFLRLSTGIWNALTQGLRCTVCLYLNREGDFTQCRNGHTLCERCHEALLKSGSSHCPTCNVVLLKSLIWNRVADYCIDLFFEFPCKYKDSGCSYMLQKGEMPNHEDCCFHKPMSCRYCQEVVRQGTLEDHEDNCQSRGEYTDDTESE